MGEKSTHDQRLNHCANAVAPLGDDTQAPLVPLPSLRGKPVGSRQFSQARPRWQAASRVLSACALRQKKI